MPDSSLSDLVTRLERERLDADRRYNDALTALDRALPAVADMPAGLATFHSLLIQFLQQITPYVDTKNRAIGGAELREQIGLVNERTLSLKREIERMATGTAPSAAAPSGAAAPVATAADRDAFKYLGFEDRFRGSRDEIRQRLTDYMPIFAGTSNVLDVGCGRGELLELFRDAGIGARGIDTNERMVSVCAERGLDAQQADALSYLRAQPDASLDGLIAVQVVEHLAPDYLMAFLEAAYLALRPGAPIVLETINVACWMAFFETYMRDLTHARPLHPDTLRFLAQASGFAQVEVVFRSQVRQEDRLPRVDASAGADVLVRALVDAINAHADQLNTRLFSSMDYALIAKR